MQETKPYVIRTMNREEMDIAVEWAAQEGWNPGIHDAEVFFSTDPQGFFIGEIDKEPVGCISAVSYGDTFGFIGFYIIKPQFRKKGYGIQLWKRAMSYLGDRNIALDGVVAQQENYKKSSFKPAHRNIRFEGTGTGVIDRSLVNLKNVDFNILLEYDTKMFSIPRPGFLKKWIGHPRDASLGILEDNEIKGYGVIRKCRRGYKIGPIFANDAAGAESIFCSLAGRFPGEPVFLDVPEVNPAAVALAEKYGMTRVFETSRMYTKNTEILPMENIFGITTFELG